MSVTEQAIAFRENLAGITQIPEQPKHELEIPDLKRSFNEKAPNEVANENKNDVQAVPQKPKIDMAHVDLTTSALNKPAECIIGSGLSLVSDSVRELGDQFKQQPGMAPQAPMPQIKPGVFGL